MSATVRYDLDVDQMALLLRGDVLRLQHEGLEIELVCRPERADWPLLVRGVMDAAHGLGLPVDAELPVPHSWVRWAQEETGDADAVTDSAYWGPLARRIQDLIVQGMDEEQAVKRAVREDAGLAP